MSLEPDRMSNTMPNAANGFSYVQSRIGVIRIRAPSRADGRARRKRERVRGGGGERWRKRPLGMPRASRINADDSSSAALADSSRGVAGKPTETDGFRFGQTGGQPSRERESLRSGFVDWPRHRTDKPTVATAVSYVARCCIRRSSPILLIPASHSLPPSPPPPPPPASVPRRP